MSVEYDIENTDDVPQIILVGKDETVVTFVPSGLPIVLQPGERRVIQVSIGERIQTYQE